MPNKKGVKSTVNTARTSPSSIRLQKRRARALELCEHGRSFKAIAAELKCANGTAFNYVAQAIKDVVPTETAAQVVAIELQRYDALLEKFYQQVLEGNEKAAELVLKISNQRSKLLGLYPSDHRTSLHFNAGGAENLCIQVIGVEPDPTDPKYYEPPLEPHRPVLALPKPANTGPNILRFEKC